MRRIRVRYCADADREHRQERRAYAHVFHCDDTICLARPFADLPEPYQLGILVHEVGHLLVGPHADEPEANAAVEQVAQFRVYYRHSSRYGSALEWIAPTDIACARAFVDRCIDFGAR